MLSKICVTFKHMKSVFVKDSVTRSIILSTMI